MIVVACKIVLLLLLYDDTEMALLTDLAVWGMEQGGLTSTIPTEVGTMTNLVFMDFDFNALTGSLPPELFLLTNLNQLDLNNNQLTGNVQGLEALTNLRFMQLHCKWKFRAQK